MTTAAVTSDRGLESPIVSPLHQATASRPRLLSRALAVRLVSVVGASTSFYLLLSVVPLAAASAGTNAAGLATAALLFASMAGEVVTPRLVARYGYRGTLAVGLVLLGVPALALAASANLVVVVAACAVRGFGFGLACVAGGALTATLIPAQRRGEGLALVGLVGGIPATIALPAGVVVAQHVGYPPVFIAGAVFALAAVVSLPGLPERQVRPHDASEPVAKHGVSAGLRIPGVRRPAVVFAFVTVSAGVVVTFLPLALAHRGGNLAAVTLLVQPAAATLARWAAGRYGDRHGAAGLLVPALLVAAAGVLALSATDSAAVVIIGAALFGIGFGVSQNATLSLMYARVPAEQYSTVSALWNFAYDAGMGVGAAAFGIVSMHTGYPLAFALTAAVMLIALGPARRDPAVAATR